MPFYTLGPLGSHWSASHDPIRTWYLPIGQLFPIPSRVPIGPLSLFKELPWCLNRHSK